jgi:hypothetical protein
MNLTTIEVSPAEAAAKLREYERQVASERTVEDEAIARAYRCAKRGLPIVRLSEVFAAGGFFPTGLPRLAICRADATTCTVSLERYNSHGRWGLVFGADGYPDNRGALVGTYTVRVAVPAPEQWQQSAYSATTSVPLVPPQHRPRRARMRRFHVLWEVEEWRRVPPRDPALLRHIRGDLWSVVATWDLTDLERAVLAGTR